MAAPSRMEVHALLSPVTAPRAPHVPVGGAPPLLVVVRNAADLDTLRDAAGRARATDRPLLVAVVVPPRPLTTDLLIHERHTRLWSALEAAIVGIARRHCAGPGDQVVRVKQPWDVTPRRARRRLLDRLAALAERHDAEIHPGTAPRHPASRADGAAR